MVAKQTQVQTLWENWGVVVDVFEINLDICVADQPLATFVLSKHCEAPLRPAVGLVPIERLKIEKE